MLNYNLGHFAHKCVPAISYSLQINLKMLYCTPLLGPGPLYFRLTSYHSWHIIHTILCCDKIWVSVYQLQQMFDSSGDMNLCSGWTEGIQPILFLVTIMQAICICLIQVSSHYNAIRILLFGLYILCRTKSFEFDVKVFPTYLALYVHNFCVVLCHMAAHYISS